MLPSMLYHVIIGDGEKVHAAYYCDGWAIPLCRQVKSRQFHPLLVTKAAVDCKVCLEHLQTEEHADVAG